MKNRTCAHHMTVIQSNRFRKTTVNRKVHEFLNRAKTFYFLTTDGDQPKGRPFGFQMLVDDTLYFGCGTFKNVFRQLTANPKVEVLAVNGGEFLRYDGTARVVHDDGLLEKVRQAPLRSERLGNGAVLP